MYPDWNKRELVKQVTRQMGVFQLSESGDEIWLQCSLLTILGITKYIQ